MVEEIKVNRGKQKKISKRLPFINGEFKGSSLLVCGSAGCAGAVGFMVAQSFAEGT